MGGALSKIHMSSQPLLNSGFRMLNRAKLIIQVAIKLKVAMDHGLQNGVIKIERSRSFPIESLPTVKFF